MGRKIDDVAKAVCREECEYEGLNISVWHSALSSRDRNEYRKVARAAIEAMREPTKEMLEAGQKAWASDPQKKVATLYRAMIDAALSEQSS